ncbi:hypothetical protein JG687_00008618, partial [Phytophthora cactorum]
QDQTKHANSSADRGQTTEEQKHPKKINKAQSWRRLEQEVAELPWCRPFTETLEDNTDLEDDTSNFEDGPDLFTADRIYAKKTNQAGQEYYLVSWVGYQELT